ncbi:MAG: methyltransferase [Clostridia bacterium]|nr:methyltransferase [Clostridia bacterium]
MQVIESLLIGNYKIIQDTEKYRFTSDSVLLARFLKAKKGEVVADFCSGSGVIGLHFYAENTGVKSVTLFEMQSELAEMSEKTVALNGLGGVFSVENLRLQDIPTAYTEKFSLILCNPPYERGGFENADPEKAACRKELALTLGELCAAAKRCLKFGGRFALVHRADRLAEVLYTLHENALEPKKMQLVAGRAGEKPYAVLVSAVKGGKCGLEVLPTRVNTLTEGIT